MAGNASTTDFSVLNTEQAAKTIGLSESTLRKMRVYGTGPKYLKLGKAVRYRPADLEAWMADRTVGSTSELAGKMKGVHHG